MKAEEKAKELFLKKFDNKLPHTDSWVVNFAIEFNQNQLTELEKKVEGMESEWSYELNFDKCWGFDNAKQKFLSLIKSMKE